MNRQIKEVKETAANEVQAATSRADTAEQEVTRLKDREVELEKEVLHFNLFDLTLLRRNFK